MNNREKLLEIETLYMALADKTRLRLLNLLRESEVCVYFLVEVLGVNQPKISRHLAYLRSAGVVEARRDGKWMNYKIVEPSNDFARRVLRNTLLWLESQEDMQTEHEKLSKLMNVSEQNKNTNEHLETEIYASTHMNNRRKELETFLL